MYEYELEAFRRGGPDPGYAGRESGPAADGWLAFCMILIFFTGLLNVFQGSVAFFRAAVFTGEPVVGNLGLWAVAWIALGVLQAGVAIALINGSRWARWVAVVLVAVNLMVNMLSIVIYPWWSLIGMGTGLVVLYGLLVQWRGDEAI